MENSSAFLQGADISSDHSLVMWQKNSIKSRHHPIKMNYTIFFMNTNDVPINIIARDVSPVARHRSYFRDCGRRREPQARGSNQVTWIILDSRLTFAAHVTAVCKACNYHIWALRRIRHLLTQRRQHISASIVGARINYCNSILHGASISSISKLQRLQNSLARVVLQQPRRTPSAVTSLAARRTSGDLSRMHVY